MFNDSAYIVSKFWNYPPSLSELRREGGHVLKNAGFGYGATVEQITYLLLAPTFGLRAAAQPCGLPVSPSARLLKLTDEISGTSFNKVAEASRLSSWGGQQRRDASATLATLHHHS